MISPADSAKLIILSLDGSMTKRISSGSTFEQTYAYSRAVDTGEWIMVAGVTGYDYVNMTISDSVVAQTEQCFKNIKNALSEVGCDLNDVVRVRYILPDKRDFAACAPVLRKYLSAAPPAATMWQADLLDDAMKIEVEVTARRKQQP